jgi:hypothetical protein
MKKVNFENQNEINIKFTLKIFWKILKINKDLLFDEYRWHTEEFF